MITEPLTGAQLSAGIARNNARALDLAQWRLSWLFRQVIPTGDFFSAIFEIPESAAFFLLEYLIIDYRSLEDTFRQIFVELVDDRGEKFTLTGSDIAGNPILGMKPKLFTSPGGDMNAPVQSRAGGAMPLDFKFPGRAQFTINIRNASPVGGGNPTFIDFLCVGHLKNKVH